MGEKSIEKTEIWSVEQLFHYFIRTLVIPTPITYTFGFDPIFIISKFNNFNVNFRVKKQESKNTYRSLLLERHKSTGTINKNEELKRHFSVT